jgi:mannose/fructose/N-acetylgalactosamine-specific phosphotransferase system component IIB
VPLLLARVDDRLIHGQVVHGWGVVLAPTLIAIVSDSLRSRPEHAELFLLAVPEGTRGRVISTAEALAPDFAADVTTERTILIFPGIGDAVRLHEGGFELREVNIGGLHHAPGKTEVLPFVYLDAADREHLGALLRAGVVVYAQDLPSNPRHPVEPWVAGAGAA